MSQDTRVAPAGKASAAIVSYVRRYGVEASERRGVGLSRRQLQRIAAGVSWADGWRPKRVPDGESRDCLVCGITFMRRFANGRLRSDVLWARKVTCGPACSLRHSWRTGNFRRKGGVTAH